MYPLASSAPDGRTPASPRFPEIERRILAYWDEDGTFQASIDQRPALNEDGSQNEFVFYDGPPFANGLPHYGHLLTGYVKDLVARYQTQQGRRVERRFGWDTHGLPAELEAMKQLGMTDKSEIEAMGIDTFNDACRSSVLKYTDQWQDYVTRQARWVDFENDYKTLTPDFMESVIWAFSELHRKGLTYRGFRVLPYCWNDETPLSNHELRMDDDVYQDRQDQTVTVTFPFTGEKAEQLGLLHVRLCERRVPRARRLEVRERRGGASERLLRRGAPEVREVCVGVQRNRVVKRIERAGVVGRRQRGVCGAQPLGHGACLLGTHIQHARKQQGERDQREPHERLHPSRTLQSTWKEEVCVPGIMAPHALATPHPH